MKRVFVMPLVLAAALVGIAPLASLADEPSTAAPAATEEKHEGLPTDYMVLKAGIYSPSEKFDVETINGGQAERIDPKTGFDGELAFGHYFLPFFAMELSGGYFHSKGSPVTGGGETKLNVVPVLLTAKALVPLGPIEPYAEGGAGFYLTRFQGTGELNSFTATTKGTYGFHAGGGLNINLSRHVFIGAEARYLWSKLKIAGQFVNMNGFTVTGDLGFRF